MTMPEAAVHKDRNPPTPEDDIGLSRKVPRMQPKPVAHRVQELANGHLRAGIASPDASHEGAALFLAHDVKALTQLASARNPW